MKIAYVLGVFPSISETFILREIVALRERGIEIALFALRRPEKGTVHADADELSGDVCYRPPLLARELIAAQVYFLCQNPLRYVK